MRSGRGILIEHAVHAVSFITNRRETSAVDLASELGISRQQALIYLHAMMGKLPLDMEERIIQRERGACRQLIFKMRRKGGII